MDEKTTRELSEIVKKLESLGFLQEAKKLKAHIGRGPAGKAQPMQYYSWEGRPELLFKSYDDAFNYFQDHVPIEFLNGDEGVISADTYSKEEIDMHGYSVVGKARAPRKRKRSHHKNYGNPQAGAMCGH